jgi:hypothetical protein
MWQNRSTRRTYQHLTWQNKIDMDCARIRGIVVVRSGIEMVHPTVSPLSVKLFHITVRQKYSEFRELECEWKWIEGSGTISCNFGIGGLFHTIGAFNLPSELDELFVIALSENRIQIIEEMQYCRSTIKPLFFDQCDFDSQFIFLSLNIFAISQQFHFLCWVFQ